MTIIEAAIPWEAQPPGAERERARIRALRDLVSCAVQILDDGLPMPPLCHCTNDRRVKSRLVENERRSGFGRRQYDRDGRED